MTPEDQLEFCLKEVAAGRKTVAECVALFPETPGLETRLGVAQALKAWPAADLSPDARQRIEQRLREQVVRRPHSTGLNSFRLPWFSPTLLWGRRFILATGLALIVVVALLGGGGLVYAANDALPGDALYPMKTTVEAARLALAGSETETVALRLEFMARRLDEIEALLNANRAARVPQTLAAYTAEVQAAATAIMQTPRDSTIQPAQAALQAQAARLAALGQRVPPQAQAGLDQAEAASLQALEALGARDTPVEVPGPKLPPEAAHTQPAAAPTHRAAPTGTPEPTTAPGATAGSDQGPRQPQPTDQVKPTHPAPKPTHPSPPTPVPSSVPGGGNGQPGKPNHTPGTPPTPKH